jgi:hypothetical protein
MEEKSRAATGRFAARDAAIDGRHESFGRKPIEQGACIEREYDLGAVAAGAPLPLHALRVRPKEDKAVQERVPIGRLKPIIECAHKRGGWHRSLIADHYAARQPNVVRSMHAKQHVALRLCDAREIKQAFGAH